MKTNMDVQIVITKIFWHFEKEEAWLEKMALQGWRLVHVSGWSGYKFVKMDPQALTYKIDFRQFKNKQDTSDYLTLFEDGGWHCAAANVGGFNYYFYTASGDAPKDIFSDADSQIQRYQRYSQYMGMSLLVSFLPLLVVFLNSLTRLPELGYLTPGLWQMEGWKFISHFLFETPFVLFRSAVFWFPPIFLLGVLYFYLHFYYFYKKGPFPVERLDKKSE
jgi:hypothetical protein